MPGTLRNVLPRYAISELHFGKFPEQDYFQCWRVSFKTEVCASWINEVEMAGSTDDLLMSQSI